MFEHLVNTLNNWTTADIRTVPGVMYQVRYTRGNNNVEYRFHLFMSSEETYVHNHQNDFLSYCIQGEYYESLWKIDTSRTDAITYVFTRNSGNDIGLPEPIRGALRLEEKRHHYPGNVLSVASNQFHSISPASDSTDMVITFVARYICPTATTDTVIWSNSESIHAPTHPIRSATADERAVVYTKLKQIYKQRFS